MQRLRSENVFERSNLKVCMIDFHADLILNNEGSAQKVIKSFCDNLDIDISCLSISYDFYKERIINNVKYYTIPENRLKNKIFNKFLNLKVFTYEIMIDLIEKEKFDILHFHNRLELVDKLVEKLSYRPKIVCHFHREFNNPIIPKSADLILGVSQNLANDIKQKTKTNKKLEFIHNSIPHDVFQFKKEEFNEIKKPIQLLFAFGDNKRKGYLEVLEAIELLEKNGVDYQLNICGNKTELNFDNDKIKVYGFLKNKELFNLMKNIDILLAPSHKEALGLIYLEGLYFGCYILPSRVGGIPEIFGKNYEFYCDLNGNSIYENIMKILKVDKNKYSIMRDEILNKFEIKNLAMELMEKYKALMK